MEAVKKQRKAMRTAFTKALNAFIVKMESDCTNKEKIVAFQFLETKMSDLDAVHTAYNQKLFESDLEEADINKELETDDAYKTQFLMAKLKITRITTPTEHATRTTSSNAMKTSKFPKLELPKFSGHIKDWLPFWSQFRKINDDQSINNEDKMQYLQQVMVADSRAHELVKSFSPTGENYDKAITSLKNRFGRDDIVVEFYVRELLSLVLQNAVRGNKKLSLASIYDKVECYIRALETLGVTTDKCAAMLYPLVESSLPEEVLRAWQRSGQREVMEANGQRETTDRLEKLLKFLQLEVENEERIDMALTGFGLPTDQERTKKAKGKTEPSKEAASASVLLVAKDSKKPDCIFCKSSHDSQSCESARKLTLDERKETVKREGCCFNCLKRGHVSQKCRVKTKCDWCSKRHVLLMCPGIFRNENVVNKPDDTSEKKAVDEHNLASFCVTHDVCLQTLRIKLYSATREKIVRAIIDTASQRSYIRTDIARELGYVSLGEIEVSHAFFGGIKSEKEVHNMYKIRVRGLDNSYACNFSAMNQNTICGPISSIKCDSWVNELRTKNINLTDIGNQSDSIDVLIGADVAGKLLIGRKHDMKNGLTALETHLGWTVMGKLPKKCERTDAAMIITTMFVQEVDLSDLWRLDAIGITDPIVKTDKAVRDERTREFLIETAKLNTDGRYEVRLPWAEDRVPVSSNSISREWLAEGIIERVPDAEINKQSHYLPHRPVVKMNSTTKIRPVFDASACKKGHPSLNQCLERDPNLIELVPLALNKFREKEIGIVSDIKKAFLQITINKIDRDYLRFFWIINGEIVVLRHCRVVFGLACSPFLLAAIIELHLSTYLKNGNRYCRSADKLKKSFYVDNCVTSVNSKEEKETFVSEATAIMRAGGFELRGWESSYDSLENETTFVLGILWNKREDTLSINPTMLNFNSSDVITKRIILSAAHKIFDPIGFTSPTSLLPKLLLKELWAEKIDWDTRVDEN
ncbi:uncharacterized protein LOC118644875 [Monomorium pharaonis]|uniref:uncharacterized protein LOC118644875 n=1 Tax=Monomorium pharaonis TaxID=307658 RepID=UPI001745E4DA|nr:uncharacterized protein LOC118644875 [Monomorium pharaonis]